MREPSTLTTFTFLSFAVNEPSDTTSSRSSPMMTVPDGLSGVNVTPVLPIKSRRLSFDTYPLSVLVESVKINF